MDGKSMPQDIKEIYEAIVQGKNHHLELRKTIYPSRVKKTSKDIEKILSLAIQTHLDKNPDLSFKKIEKPIKNTDQSYT